MVLVKIVVKILGYLIAVTGGAFKVFRHALGLGQAAENSVLYQDMTLVVP